MTGLSTRAERREKGDPGTGFVEDGKGGRNFFNFFLILFLFMLEWRSSSCALFLKALSFTFRWVGPTPFPSTSHEMWYPKDIWLVCQSCYEFQGGDDAYFDDGTMKTLMERIVV